MRDKEQVPSLGGREGACNGIKEVRDPMQGIFSVSASNKGKDSTDSHSAPVTSVYMQHE